MSTDILVIDPNDDDEYAEEAALDGVEQLEEPPSRNWQLSIAAGLIVSLVLIGETVGGLIGLNNFENLELGAGIATITTCDPDISVKPVAKVEGSGDNLDFKLDAVELSGIGDECLNKTFTLSLYTSNFGQGANFATRLGNTNAPVNFLKFTLATKQPTNLFGGADVNDPDWRIYPKVTRAGTTQIANDALPNPLSAAGLEACIGQGFTTPDINFDSADMNWTGRFANPGCSTDNYLVNIYGYISFPGVDDGSLHSTTLSISGTGNTSLSIAGRKVIDDRSTHAIATRSGTFLHRKGSTYAFDLWHYHGTGNGELKLLWNRNTSGAIAASSPVPSEALSFDNTVEIVIPSSEGVTNYSVIALQDSNQPRAVRVVLGTPKVSTAAARKFTLETSD